MKSILAGLIFLTGLAANSTTWTVTTATDDLTGTQCAADNTCVTLRDAIFSAASGDKIVFNTTGTINITSGGTLNVNAGTTLTIDGSALASPGIAIDGGGTVEVMTVAGVLTLNSLTIQNGGDAAGDTGGVSVLAGGALTVSNCTLTGNLATLANTAGAIANNGVLVVTNSTFANNSGGAIFGSVSSTATIVNSTFFSNNVGVPAIRVASPGTATLQNTFVLKSSPVANCSGVSVDSSNAADDTSCGSASNLGATPVVAVLDPLGLQNNGGPTKTIAISQGSVAADAGNNAYAISAGLTTDQRGNPRIVGGTVAIGAYEPSVPTANVCPGLSTNCSTLMTVHFNVPSGTTLNATTPVSVVTQGSSGLDFTEDAANTTCTSGLAGPAPCVLSVNFGPKAPGMRFGTAAIVNTAGNPVGTGVIYAQGIGSALSFDPGATNNVAGNGTASFSGDGAAATAAQINNPAGVAVDDAGNIYIADSGNNRVRKVDAATGVITTIAGTGASGFSGDNGLATSATLSGPQGVAVGNSGNIFIADSGNSRIRAVNVLNGTIRTVAGSVTIGYAGDGGLATAAALNNPSNVLVDGVGSVYIADTINHVIRKVTSGIISTIAGNNTAGFGGDGGPATSAQLNVPQQMAFDSSGNLYIADSANHRVRMVTAATGKISTVAGSALVGSSGDNGPATSAGIGIPIGLAVDAAGDIYISDLAHNNIRKVNAAGTISTIASTSLSGPSDLALDGAASVYIADKMNNFIRKLDVTTSKLSFGDVPVDGISAALNVGVSDVGNALLNFSFGTTGPFVTAGSSTCVSPLSVGADCVEAAQFSPLVTGQQTGTLVATDDAFNSPQTVNLDGNGVAAALQSITVAPTSTTIAAGGTVPYSATGNFSDGSTQNLTSSVTWSSDNTNAATITTSGLATTIAAGTAHISASVGSITSNSATLNVTSAVLVSLAITPTNATINAGGTQQYTATGTFSDGSMHDQTGNIGWNSDNTAVATIVGNGSATNGQATGVASGTAHITAVGGSITSNSATLAVLPVGGLQSISVSPATASIPVGATQHFTATGSLVGGGTTDLTNSVTWSSDSAAVTVNATGIATGVSLGGANITATLGSFTNSASVTVTDAALVSIAVAPLNAMISIGASQQYTATGTYTDASTQDISSSVTWSSDNQSVATISVAGLASGVAAGTASIHATSGAIISNSATLAVIPAGLTSITVSPATASIPLGETRQFTATGNLSNNTTVDLTHSVTWSSANTSVATVTSTGLATALATTSAGVNIVATLGSVSNFAVLTVTPAILVSLAISPTTQSISIGGTQQYTAIGTFSDGSTHDQTSNVVWASDTTSVASINFNTGLANGVAAGAAHISASTGSVSSNSVTLTVLPVGLLSVIVAPASSTIPVGATQQFTAIGNVAGGGTTDLTNAVTWSSDNAAVTVNQAGLATGVSLGGANITATLGSFSNSAAVTVSAAALVSIVITPLAATINVGGTQQFVASGTYTDGSHTVLTNSVTWSSDNLLAATISNVSGTNGLASGVFAGVVHVSATLGSVTSSTSATLTVNSVVASALAISPANVNFGNVHFGHFALKAVNLTNTGTTSIAISSVAVSKTMGSDPADFFAFSFCPKTLLAGRSCFVIVSDYARNNVGAQSATLLITDSAAGSPQQVPLSATMINPHAKLSTTNLNFGYETQGVASAPEPVTLTNTGTTDLSISKIAVTGSFVMSSNTCGSTLAVGQSCTVGVEFAPVSTGRKTGALTFTDNALFEPQVVRLSGTGR